MTRDDGATVVLFDGVCGLCNRLVRFIAAHDRRARFRFAPLQGDWARATLARHGLDAADLDSLRVIVRPGASREAVLSRSRATIFVARRLDAPWNALALAGVFPATLLDAAYDRVAASRYRVFGRHASCPMPSDALRARMLA